MLILYGGRRSPFVRRIAIWLALQQRPFERRYVNVFGPDFESMKAMNPVGRVPVLSIAEDEHLIETAAIIDYLEDTAPAVMRLIPKSGPDRWRCQQRIACANSVAEKGVALVYEAERRPDHLVWADWRDRLVDQVRGGLVALENMAPHDGWMGGNTPDGSDVAAVCAHDFVAGIAGIDLVADMPKLAALSARANLVAHFLSELFRK